MNQTKTRHLKFESPVTNYDESTRMVYGYVSVADIVDLQGDYIPQDEFIKMVRGAMHKYNAGLLTVDGNHQSPDATHSGKDIGDIMEINIEYKAGTLRWPIAVYVKNDDSWKTGRENGFHGFSIGGEWKMEYDPAKNGNRLYDIELTEFSLLYGNWKSGGKIHPANQLSTIVGVKSISTNFSKQWSELRSKIDHFFSNLNKGDQEMNPEELKKQLEAQLAPALEKHKAELTAEFAKFKKELSEEDWAKIKETITQIATEVAAAAMKGSPEDQAAAKAKADKEKADAQTLANLAKTVEEQGKSIEALLKASAKAGDQGAAGQGADVKKSAKELYAEHIKSKSGK